MMGEHINYENDKINDSRCSNHMNDNQSGTAEAWWSSRKKVLPDSSNIEEILQQKTGSKLHTWSIVDAPKKLSGTNVSEHEVAQPIEVNEKKMTP